MIKEKEVTIYDIAGKLKISVATVSRALKDDPVVNKDTRKKITDLALEMGYRSNLFARNLRNQKTNTIGVIVPRLNSYFMSTVIAGIETVANAEGYNLIISQSSESAAKEMSCAKTMFDNRVDGLLVSLAYDTEDLSHFDSFFKKNIPLIFFDRVIEHKKCTHVLIDNRKAAYDATSHLIQRGCTNIVHITALSNSNVYADRLQGYRQALEAHNLPFKNEQLLYTNLSQESGFAAAATILRMKQLPDGIFVANDNCAAGCMIALKQAGIRIPEQVAFVGFNNDPVCAVVEPQLTTINYPGYKMGEVAALSLITHLNGTATMLSTDSILLRSELIIRGSSKRR